MNSYIAFISYRHTPLDMQAAQKIQKKIENYTIPEELREQFGDKKFGHVFRDQDELPSSASLSDSIRDAIDRSKFLVVICTPDLPKSKWCEAEIKYFLETHDRDHLLAVLVDGTPEESFSPYMLHDFDEDGNPITDYEPLAANISGPGHKINGKEFNKEVTRLFAAFLGCPFDTLWQREKRARMARLLTASAVAIAILSIFLGVVLNRNARISEQNVLIEAQNKELQAQLSTALVSSGISKLEDHDVRGAIEDALASMGSGDPDIYDHKVGKLLSDALYAYAKDEMQSSAVYSQSTGINKIRMADDEKHMLLLDEVGLLRCLNLVAYEPMWEVPTGDASAEIYTKNLRDRVIYKTSGGVFCLNLMDGKMIWSVTQEALYGYLKYGNAFQAISDDGSLFAIIEHDESGSKWEIVFLNTVDGTERGRVDPMASDAYSPSLYSGDNAFSYAAAFSPDNARFAYVIPVVRNEDQAAEYHLGYVDMTTLEKQMIASIGAQNYLFYGMDIDPADGSIFMAIYTGTFAETVLCKLDGEIKANDVEHRFASSAGMDFTNDFFETSDCRFLSKTGRIYLFSDQMMFVYNRADNELLNFYTLPGSIVNAYWVDPEIGLLEVITDDGLITDYYMSFSDNKILSGVEVLQSDQSIVTKSCSAGNGAVVDQGSIYTISDSIPGKLLYVDFVTDPNVETLNSYAEPDAETFAYTVTVGEDKDLEFVDVLTGKTSVIDNPYHLSGDPTPVLAHAANLCAAVYEDGTACVMNIEDRSVERLKKEYAAGEIMSFCFSDDDAYLLVITSSGRLDIYETGTFALMFSERVKRFALDTNTLSRHDLKAQSSKDGETLFATIADYCVILDTRGWEEITGFRGESLVFDKESGTIYSKRYSDYSNAGDAIIAYPYYDIPALKEWAERVVGGN